MGDWLSLLKSIPDEEELLVSLSRKSVPLVIEGKSAAKNIEQISLGCNEPISEILESFNFDTSLEEGIYEQGFVKETFGLLKREDGYSRVYVLYDMPVQLPWGWIHSVFGTCTELKMWIKPIKNDVALNMMTKKQAILSNVSNNRRAEIEHQHAVTIEAALIDGKTRLFEMALICVVNGESQKNLEDKCKNFDRNLRVTGAQFDAVTGKQGASYYGEWRKRLLCDLLLFSVMYPFHSAELLELPAGVMLGRNLSTHGPIIYDITKRTNGNVAIIGTSGSGKSFTAKLLIKRLIEHITGDKMNDDSEIAIYILDPMDDFYQHKEYYGLDGLRITGREELGLDPIKIMEPLQAASLLSTVIHADIPTSNEIMKHVDAVGDVDELYKAVSGHAQEFLQHLVDGPMTKVMRGQSQFTDRMVVSLEGATGKPHEILIMLLVLNKIWNQVVTMPKTRPKLIVLDEGWLLAQIPGAMSYIEQIARMGRKLNIKFVFISQRVDDIAEEKGAAGKLIDNMGTKIVMQLEEDAAKNASKVMGLSEYEQRSLRKFSQGEGLILTERHRVLAKFEATVKETAVYFNTKPDE